jgi:DNA-directed RNA polymerase specialized sigma24 family protein
MSVVKIQLSRFRRRVAACRHIPINEFFNECFVTAKTSNSEAEAMTKVYFALVSMARGDTRPGSRSSRRGDRTEDKRERREKRMHLDEHIALKLDLEKAFSLLSYDDVVLLQLRIVQGLTQRETANLLNITLDVEQGKEHRLMRRLSQALSDWR